MSLTSRIQALTTYANEVTGESDTTLSDAVATLAEGYGSGSGSGGLTLLNTITFDSVRGQRVNIDASWFDNYNYVLIVPSFTVAGGDWIYINSTGENSDGSYYTSSTANYDYTFGLVGTTSGKFSILRFMGNGVAYTTFIYFYTYSASKTMTGKFDIYGLNL